jgi:hypothetical protein
MAVHDPPPSNFHISSTAALSVRALLTSAWPTVVSGRQQMPSVGRRAASANEDLMAGSRRRGGGSARSAKSLEEIVELQQRVSRGDDDF